MNFKPTKIKVLVSIIAIIAWYMFLYYVSNYMTLCEQCNYIDNGTCPNVFSVNLIPEGCSCGCPSETPIGEVLLDLIILLAPGILTYIIWSSSQKERKK
ncbi:MAG: hypothetical protein ACP5NZ_01195 [Nanobdellota archaeon]